MFVARVYKIMIGAPSDIKEEVQIAKEVVHEWNYINTESHHKVLLPLHWSISCYPSSGKHPQKLINEQIVNKSDLLICIFGLRLGSPTDTDISGSVEEINEHLNAGKEVMIFFRKNLNISSTNDLQQATKLLEFKESIKGEVLFEEYNDEKEFKPLLEKKLQLFLNNKWLNPDYIPNEIAGRDVEISLNKKEITIPYKSTENIEVKGVELDRCDIKVEDNFYAYASTNNGEIEIEGRKVGTTKLTVSYGEKKSECAITIIPMSTFCGTPMLHFNSNYLDIKNKCKDIIKEDNNLLICKENDIFHHYLFKDNHLILVMSYINANSDTSSNFLNAYNSMNERYRFMTNAGNNIYWYQQHEKQFYIVSVQDKKSKDWYFFYSPSQDLIRKNIENIKG